MPDPKPSHHHGQLTLWPEPNSSGGWQIAGEAADPHAFAAFHGDVQRTANGATLRAPADAAGAAALRLTLPYLRPTPLGLQTSAGFGDRLGLATPGHIDALRASGAEGRIAPIFAQQSVRENTRTGRTPQAVLDDATLGAFAAGWHGKLGADADHLKNEADIDAHLSVGFSFFTIDPGAHVRAEADTLSGEALERIFTDEVPWAALESSPAALRARLSNLKLDLGEAPLRFRAGELERAAVKYGAAVAHVVRMARHVRSQAGPERAELEISVDETDTPTSHAEHAYFASELRRLGVTWISLAPRFVGAFEKGVDYLGDLGLFARDLRGHAAIASQLGPYKLSLHSGSDKFAAYPIAAAICQGQVHLKTAGTSYLEALRVIGAHEPALLHRIAELALERFADDVASYHISGSPAGMPQLADLHGGAIATLIEQRDARQVLHVTFGSVLSRYRERIVQQLQAHPADYRAALRRHFERHLSPFVPHAHGGSA